MISLQHVLIWLGALLSLSYFNNLIKIASPNRILLQEYNQVFLTHKSPLFLSLYLSFFSFIKLRFNSLIDNGNSAKMWSPKTISVLCKLDWSRVSVDWYIVYNYFFNEKGATLYCLKFPLWFYISKIYLPTGSRSILLNWL